MKKQQNTKRNMRDAAAKLLSTEEDNGQKNRQTCGANHSSRRSCWNSIVWNSRSFIGNLKGMRNKQIFLENFKTRAATTQKKLPDLTIKHQFLMIIS